MSVLSGRKSEQVGEGQVKGKQSKLNGAMKDKSFEDVSLGKVNATSGSLERVLLCKNLEVLSDDILKTKIYI